VKEFPLEFVQKGVAAYIIPLPEERSYQIKSAANPVRGAQSGPKDRLIDRGEANSKSVKEKTPC